MNGVRRNGKNLMEMKDQTGKCVTKAKIESTRANGSGWTDYEWVHPETKKLAGKTTYSIKTAGGDSVVGVGFYR